MILPLVAIIAQAPSVWHEFVLATDSQAKSVHVAGTFNGWDKGKNALVKDASGLLWRKKIAITPGKHLYKFVINGDTWVLDPKNKLAEDDGNGHTNSVLMILPKGFERPAKPGDGVITVEAVTHPAQLPNRNWDKGVLSLWLTARPNDVESVTLVINGRAMPLSGSRRDELVTDFKESVPWSRKEKLSYYFVLRDGKTKLVYDAKGLRSTPKPEPLTLTPKQFRSFDVPEWVEGTVFYQIFPDRFENGSPHNDPKDKLAWEGKPDYTSRMGGDAAGVIKRASYLSELGVNGVYINPVMAAPAYHRYDPVDFYNVDHTFGTNDEFVAMVKTLDNRGIRVVLDQIFDHVGTTFGPFVDLIKHQQASNYKDWFFVKEWPVEVRQNPPYEAWFGGETMPKVNVMHPEVQKYLMGSVEFWMERAPLSGWRLDVANEVPMDFWRQFRKSVKAINREAWIVGEVWSDATAWLQGDQWDASMNYPFREAVLGFLGTRKATATQFANNLMRVYNLYAPQVSRNQLNLLSSHDTERFFNIVKGNLSLAKLGASVQFTWPGAPSIYYGEEIGMMGGPDPDNRRGMQWNLVGPKNDLLRHYQTLIELRRSCTALITGKPVILTANDQQETLAYARESQNDVALIAINRSASPRTVRLNLARLSPRALASAKKLGLTDALSGSRIAIKGTEVSISLQPISAVIAVNPIDAGKASKPSINLHQEAR